MIETVRIGYSNFDGSIEWIEDVAGIVSRSCQLVGHEVLFAYLNDRRSIDYHLVNALNNSLDDIRVLEYETGKYPVLYAQFNAECTQLDVVFREGVQFIRSTRIIIVKNSSDETKMSKPIQLNK